MTFRVLVTGSRAAKPNAITELGNLLVEAVDGQPGPYTLVHGDAPGADQLFAIAARHLGWTIEPHPADWDGPCTPDCDHGRRVPRKNGNGTWCTAAGPRRNAEMVALGADTAIAVYKRGVSNKGTAGCARLIGEAHIPLRRVTVA